MSKQEMSEDTKVVLLLCGRFGGEKQEAYQPLANKEYDDLTRWLKAREFRPCDLMTPTGHEALSGVLEAGLERKRIDFLLGRGTAVALALERWARGGLWVISRGDAEFPKRLKRQLKRTAPALLYGAGDKALLDKGGLAIIGSRDASESALSYTRSIAARCANEGMAVVSGGARGVDAAAMQGATEAGGCCIGVLANDLLKTTLNRQNRMGLQEGRLVLVSPFYPEAGFNAGSAMGRNRYIYNLADQALVIESALRSGGTWAGAVENLKKVWVPLYVRTPGDAEGNAALVADGGLPFTLTEGSTDTLTEFFGAHAVNHPPSENEIVDVQHSFVISEQVASDDSAHSESPPISVQETILAPLKPEELAVQQPPSDTDLLAVSALSASSDARGKTVEGPLVEEKIAPASSSTTLDMYSDFAAKLGSLLSEGALSEEEISMQLCIEKSQAKAWLKRASETGIIEKLKKPVRYTMRYQNSLC